VLLRREEALLCARFDKNEWAMIMALVAEGRPMPEQALVGAAWRIGGLLRESRYR
jgi:hypothetical protein